MVGDGGYETAIYNRRHYLPHQPHLTLLLGKSRITSSIVMYSPVKNIGVADGFMDCDMTEYYSHSLAEVVDG